MVVFAITIACLPFQVRMLRSKYSQFLLTTLGNAMCLSFAGKCINVFMRYDIDLLYLLCALNKKNSEKKNTFEQ